MNLENEKIWGISGDKRRYLLELYLPYQAESASDKIKLVGCIFFVIGKTVYSHAIVASVHLLKGKYYEWCMTAWSS